MNVKLLLTSHQLASASLLLALTGKVEVLHLLDQPISSILLLLCDPAPGPFLHFMAQCWKVDQITACSGNQFTGTLLWSHLL